MTPVAAPVLAPPAAEPARSRRAWPVGLLLLALLAAAGAGAWWLRSDEDAWHRAAELWPGGTWRSYDALIAEVATRRGVDPALVKAVVWRESRFRAGMTGAAGERGLMQVSEGAAGEWARAEKVATFVPTDLFDPKTNLEAGTWYLARALRRWSTKDDPIPFALAEYNAGRTNVNRWTQKARGRPQRGNAAEAEVSGPELEAAIGFPSTRQYVASIRRRMEFYRARGGK